MENNMSDWTEIIRLLSRNETLSVKQADNPNNYLIYSPVPWAQGNIERMLSIALQLRGHIVDEIICGGNLPACGMEHSNQPRPNCSACNRSAEDWFNMWNLTPISTENFRDRQDIEIAEQVVKHLHLEHHIEINYKELKALKFNGFPIGIRIYEKVFWYFSGNFSDTEAVLAYLVKCAVSYILGISIAQKILTQKTYNAIIVTNGKTIEGSPIIDVAKRRGIRCITWEELFVFDNYDPVIEFNQYGVWESVKNCVLSKNEKSEIENIFSQWKISEKTSWVKNPIMETNIISYLLKLRNESFKIALFPNLLLDSSIIGMHIAFDSLFDWLYSCVDYAIANPDVDLIIRIHPAEKVKFDFLTSQVRVADEIKKRYGLVPNNVFLIESDSNISSYGLLQLVDIPITYNGTLALEAPFNNRLCVLAGKSHFRNKGFTIDLETKDELYAMFDKRQPLRTPTDYEKELAYRYAYFYKIRMIGKPDFYNKKSVTFDVKSLHILENGGHVFWDNLCESIIKNYAFIDLDKKDRVPIDLNGVSRTDNGSLVK